MSSEESTALATLGGGPRAVAFRNLDDVERFAELVYKSTLVPKEYRNNKADVVGVIAFGLELGLNPMAALQNVSWINGKPSVYGDMALAMVEASGLLEAFDEVDPEAAQRTGVARCTLKRRGKPPITRTYTKAMAEQAKLWGKAGPWSEHSGRMLQMRARGWALRDAFSDVLKGLYTVEEARDIELTPDQAGTYTYAPPAGSTPPSAPAGAGAVAAERPAPGLSGTAQAPGSPAAVTPPPSVCDGLTPEAIAALPKSAVLNKIRSRLHELAPGSTREAKGERQAYMREAFRKEAYPDVEALGLSVEEQP